MNSKVITRFAPSPTGYLHIGGARTALFNWLFARHHGGQFLLRIEDTDRQRSTDAAIQAIIEGMNWLGLDWDGDIIYQFSRAARHAAIARQLLEEGKAYYCYSSPQELEEMRATAKASGKPMRYDGRWRDRDRKDAPEGIAPVIRLKAPLTGHTIVHDQVQGEVKVANEQLDDMVLLRSDGTPTYMLSVVVDDHDMGITHVIRGDDHLTNTFRQVQLYQAMNWSIPQFAHIPLIHGADGAKLSKRHGALAIDAYRDMGYLPEAMRNYLLRLGWSHGDEEIISTKQAIEWFNLESIGQSPSRLDFMKLDNVNSHYLRLADDQMLANHIADRLNIEKSGIYYERLIKGMEGLKPRAKTLKDLAEQAKFYTIPRPIPLDPKAQSLLTEEARKLLSDLLPSLELCEWQKADLEQTVRHFVEKSQIKLGQIAQPLRAALTGSAQSPGLFEVMEVLGKEETVGRLKDI